MLNDEHTDRKFVFYFMLGWGNNALYMLWCKQAVEDLDVHVLIFVHSGIPVLCIALYVIITHAVYNWGIEDMYADVHNNGDT